MNTKNIVPILCIMAYIGYSGIGWAQTYTLKISTPEDEIPFGGIPDQNNGLFALIWRGVFNPDITPTTYYFDYRNLVYHIDDQGSITDSVEIDTIDGFDLALRGFIKVGDSLLIWGDAYNIANESSSLALLWMDYNLQIIDLKLLGNYTDTTQFFNYAITSDGNLIFAGSLPDLSWTLRLVKTTGTGTLLQDTTIPGWAGPYPNIGYLPSTDQLICGRYHWVGYINVSDLTVDSAYYPLYFDLLSYGYYKPWDSYNCILPNQFPGWDTNWDVGCYLIDTSAQTTDSAIFDLPYKYNISVEVDYISTDTIFLGAIGNSIFEPPNMGFNPIDRIFAVFKFNMNGELFWERYLNLHCNLVLTDIAAMRDGGCALLGTYYDWRTNPELERDALIYKLDSEGLITQVPEFEEDLIKIIPNPASDRIMIKLPDKGTSNIVKKIIQIYDMLGNRMFTIDWVYDDEIMINITDFPPGMYLLSIVSEGQLKHNQKLIVY